MVIDPEANTTTTFSAPAGSNKYSGGVLAPNGKIYTIPSNSTFILEIDPLNNTTYTFGSFLTTNGKYSGGVLAPNGKIYALLGNANNILVILDEIIPNLNINLPLSRVYNKSY